LKVTDVNSRSRNRIRLSEVRIPRSGSGAGSVPNVTDPQHCLPKKLSAVLTEKINGPKEKKSLETRLIGIKNYAIEDKRDGEYSERARSSEILYLINRGSFIRP
jgi:hypothetical protein